MEPEPESESEEADLKFETLFMRSTYARPTQTSPNSGPTDRLIRNAFLPQTDTETQSLDSRALPSSDELRCLHLFFAERVRSQLSSDHVACC